MHAVDTLQWQFDDDVWREGVRLHRHRAVASLAYDERVATWSARVRDERESHDVWLAFEGVDDTQDRIVIDGDCACTTAKPCSHLAALAVAVVDALTPSPASAHDRTTARQAIDELGEWAKSATRLLADDGAREGVRPAPKRPTMLRFVLRVGRAWADADPRPRVSVSTFSAAQRRGSEQPSLQRFDVGAAIRRPPSLRPAWLSDDDQVLWFGLEAAARRERGRSLSDSGSSIAIPWNDEGARSFDAVLATGRCHLDAPTGLPLLVGPPRAGRFAWRVEDDGSQELYVEPTDADGEPWTVLPIAPLFYIELATGRCGRIVTDVEPALQPWVAIVPTIDPAASTRLPVAAARVLARAGVPAPRRLETRPSRQHRCVPVLSLVARAGEGDAASPVALLAFDYDGVSFDHGDPRGGTVRIDDEVLEHITRDHFAEMAARGTLAKHGFVATPTGLVLPDEAAWFTFVRDVVPALREGGWRVEIDDALDWSVVDVDGWYANAREDEKSGETWFLELGVVIVGERVNILPAIVAAIRTGTITRARLQVADEPLVVTLPGGHRVALDRARVQAMLDVLVELHDDSLLPSGELRLGRLDLGRVHELEGFDWDIAPRLRAFADRLRDGPSKPVRVPKGLRASLREYQTRGLAWLQWLREAGLGGVLADDMGLGKTIQALSHVLVEKQARRLRTPALVVAPRSVLRNWEREAANFTPSLRTVIHHGGMRATDAELLTAHDLVITTYAILQRDELLQRIRWHLVILDEAQAIKNPATKIAVAARTLHAEQRICMTGTPMENNLGDLWSLMSVVNPGLVGTSRQFTTWYRTPIERHGDVGRFDALCRRIAPFMLRRTKAQVLTELPPKTEIVLHAALEGPQRDLYESVRMTMEKRVRDELGRRGLARSRIIVLDALLKLRQVCCDPRLVKLTEAKSIRGSAKLDLLMTVVDDLVAEGRRAIVFSQFTSMLDLVAPQLDARKIGWLSITGKTTRRQEIVDEFQTGTVPILLVSLKAGGTGLNLTAADTVIHYDPWWNPAVEAQATDRAHRMGQQRPVTVVRLICEGTVEERMLGLQAKKSALLRGVQDGAQRRADAGLGLDEGEIAELLAPLGTGLREGD